MPDTGTGHGVRASGDWWELNTEGTLSVYCVGDMPDYSLYDPDLPWGDYVFEDVTSIIILDGVTGIGNFAFSYCEVATSVTIPDSVTKIGKKAFMACYNLTDVAIPEGVITIGDAAFDNCNSMTNVTIPDSVTAIGNQAFLDCSSLADVYYGGTETQWNEINFGTGNDPLLNATIHFTEPPAPEAVQTVRFGLKNVRYAVITSEGIGGVYYDSPTPILGAVSLSLNPTELKKSLAADNLDFWTANLLNRYDGELILALVPDNFRADCLGELTDTESGVRYETSDSTPQRFALLFEFDGDASRTRHTLYNCSVSRVPPASQTVSPDDGPEPSAESLSITARPRHDGLFKARVKPRSNAYDGWFSNVFTPSDFAPK